MVKKWNKGGKKVKERGGVGEGVGGDGWVVVAGKGEYKYFIIFGMYSYWDILFLSENLQV